MSSVIKLMISPADWHLRPISPNRKKAFLCLVSGVVYGSLNLAIPKQLQAAQTYDIYGAISQDTHTVILHDTSPAGIPNAAFVQRALDITNTLEARWQVDPLTDIAIAYAHLEEVDQSQTVLEQLLATVSTIDISWRNASVLSKIVEATSHLEKSDRILAILEDTLNIVDTLETSNAKVDRLCEIAALYHHLQENQQANSTLQKALTVADLFEIPRLKVSVLNDIAIAYHQIQANEQAAQILQQALTLASNEISYLWTKAEVLSKLATTYNQLGDSQRANVLLLEAVNTIGPRLSEYSLTLNKQNQRDPEARDSEPPAEKSPYELQNRKNNALRTIITTAGQLKNQPVLTSVINAVTDPYVWTKLSEWQQVPLLEDMINATAGFDDIQQVAGIFVSIGLVGGLMENPRSQVSVWIDLAIALDRLGEPKLAQDQLNLTNNTFRLIKGFAAKISALADIATVHSQWGQDTEAQKVLEQALKIIGIGDGSQHKQRGLQTIVKAVGQLENTESIQSLLEQALVIAETIDDPLGQGSVLGSIAFHYQKLGDGAQAQTLLQQALTLVSPVYDALPAPPPAKPGFPVALSPDSFSMGELGSIASIASLLTDYEQAQPVFNQAIVIANTIQDLRIKSSNLQDVAIALASWRMPDPLTRE